MFRFGLEQPLNDPIQPLGKLNGFQARYLGSHFIPPTCEMSVSATVRNLSQSRDCYSASIVENRADLNFIKKI